MEVLKSPRSTCGEGPHYDMKTRNLYYVDINDKNSSVLCYSLDNNKVYQAFIDNLDGAITFIIPVKSAKNQFVISIGLKVVIIYWNGRSSKAKVIRKLFEVECGPKYGNSRFNDAKADPYGRLYAGTMNVDSCDDAYKYTPFSSLYEYQKKKCVERSISNVYISNGLTWIGSKFYYVDSCAYDVKEYEYDSETGDICEFNQCF